MVVNSVAWGQVRESGNGEESSQLRIMRLFMASEMFTVSNHYLIFEFRFDPWMFSRCRISLVVATNPIVIQFHCTFQYFLAFALIFQLHAVLDLRLPCVLAELVKLDGHITLLVCAWQGHFLKRKSIFCFSNTLLVNELYHFTISFRCLPFQKIGTLNYTNYFLLL